MIYFKCIYRNKNNKKFDSFHSPLHSYSFQIQIYMFNFSANSFRCHNSVLKELFVIKLKCKRNLFTVYGSTFIYFI